MRKNGFKINIAIILIAACFIFAAQPVSADTDTKDNVERLYVADFETHPTALGGKIGVYGAAAPWDWQYPGDNFSWFYDPTITPYDASNVHSGTRSFRLVNMRNTPNWASMGINLGPIIDPAADPIKVGSINVSAYNCLEFWVKAKGAAAVAVLFRDGHCHNYVPQLEISVAVSNGNWTYIAIPMSSIAGRVDVTCLVHIGFDVGSIRGNAVGAAVFIDDIAFSRTINNE